MAAIRKSQVTLMYVPEQNVINWAKAFIRAKSPKTRAHAKKMLAVSVETLAKRVT